MELISLECPNCGAPLKDFAPNQSVECPSCGSEFVTGSLDRPPAMVCPSCRTINPIETRYCSRCGKSLKQNCVLCHAENVIGAIHCANCGAHLANAQARRQKMLSERQQLRREQQQLLKEKETRQRAEKLLQLLEDLDEPENHDFAIYQIKQLGSDAVDALIKTLLVDDDPDARYGSARALGQICKEHQLKSMFKTRTTQALITALDDAEPAVRYWAADTLGKCGSQSAVQALEPLLKDKHRGVREQAERVLEQIGGEQAAKILKENKKKGLFGWLKGS